MEPSLSEVDVILREYELGRARSLERQPGGYANMNFRLVTESKDSGNEEIEKGGGNQWEDGCRMRTREVLLRICTEKTVEDVGYEMRVMEKLRSINFQAAYPIQRRDGGFLTDHMLGTMVIYEFIQGNEPECNEETVGEIARAVAVLNSMKGWGELRRRNALSIELCREVLSGFNVAPCHYPDIFQWFREETDHLEDALKEDLPVGLIHGDIFPDNTMFQGNSLQAILDWEEVCTDKLLIDVGVTINGFCFPGNRLDHKLMDTFLREYQLIRELAQRERELLPSYIRWGALAMIAWHLKYLMHEKDPKKMERVKMFMDRLKALKKNER